MDKKTQGKKNKAAGARFELKVRKDLESKGWIVSKWMNNVGFEKENSERVSVKIPLIMLDTGEREKILYGKLIPAKHKFRGPGIPMAIGTGFPDFIGIKALEFEVEKSKKFGERDRMMYNVYGIECKSNGYLTKEEKEKCRWLLENKIFTKILIASKGEKRGEIKYQEVKNNGKKDI